MDKQTKEFYHTPTATLCQISGQPMSILATFSMTQDDDIEGFDDLGSEDVG